jgi:hypothetical protein
MPGSISSLSVLCVINYGKLFMVCLCEIVQCNIQS